MAAAFPTNFRIHRFALVYVLAMMQGVAASDVFAAVEVQVSPATLEQRIGYPTIPAPRGEMPTWTIRSAAGGRLEGALLRWDWGDA